MPSECGVMSTSTAPTFCAGDDAGLDGGAHGHAQVGVDLLVRLGCPRRSSQQLADARRARAAADQHHLVDRRRDQVGVVEGTLHAIHRPVQQRLNQRLVFRRD